MTPKLRSKVRSIAAHINLTGEAACVWVLDRGTDLDQGPDFPCRVPERKHVGRYAAPCSHSDIAEDVEHVLDQLANSPSGKPGRPMGVKA